MKLILSLSLPLFVLAAQVQAADLSGRPVGQFTTQQVQNARIANDLMGPGAQDTSDDDGGSDSGGGRNGGGGGNEN